MPGMMPGMVSKLSGTTKNLTAGLLSDPQKMENIISMVRTVAPLTSEQTVTKVNTYLPLFEKVSTLLGMYSFLNRAQTFRPIQTLNAKSPVDMMTSLMKSGNLPVSKMLTQPLIANNMEKIMGTVAMNMFKNGNMNDLLKNVNINDMISSFAQNSGSSSDNSGNIDLNSLMETFMPMISSMNAANSDNDNNDSNNHIKSSNSYEESTKNIELKNEHYLPEQPETADYAQSNAEFTYDDTPKNNPYDRNYRNDKYDNYEKSVNYNDHKNNYNEKKEMQKPIRIKQRKRR